MGNSPAAAALAGKFAAVAREGVEAGVFRVWALDLDDLIRIAKTQVTRELSDDECRQYLHLPDGCP